MIGFHDAEHAGRHALADGIIHAAGFRQNPAMRFGHQHRTQFFARGGGPMHARHIGHKPGAIGNRHHFNHRLGAVDEFNQHAGIHVAGPRLRFILLGHRIKLERIVLALAGADNFQTQRLRKADELDGAGRFIAHGPCIDNAGALGLRLEMAADGDVGFHIQHHHMLAVVDGIKGKACAHIRIARGINHHINAPRRNQRGKIIGDGQPPALNGAVNVSWLTSP